MTATHGIEIIVRVFPDDMDGTPEESANIIWNLLHDAIADKLDSQPNGKFYFESAVTKYWEVEK